MCAAVAAITSTMTKRISTLASVARSLDDDAGQRAHRRRVQAELQDPEDAEDRRRIGAGDGS